MKMYIKGFVPLIMMSAILVLALPMLTHASQGEEHTKEWPTKKEVPPNHQWSIYFNTDLKESTLNEESVQVYNQQGEQVQVDLHHAGDHVTIIPPKGGYQAGSTYKLMVRNSIHSTEGKRATSKNEMTFHVASNYSPLTKKDVRPTSKDKQLYINGEKNDSILFSHNKMTYLPIKPIVVAMGDKYVSGEEFDTIQLDDGKSTYRIYSGRNVVYDKDQQAIPLTTETRDGEDVPGSSRVIQIKGKKYLPIRMISEVLNYSFKTDHVEGKTHYLFGNEKASVQKESPKRTYENPMDVPLLNQMNSPQLYNGCEVTSLAMILLHHGIEVTKNELAQSVKQVPLTYSNGIKGNPNKGFVGDMQNGPGLSVYHDPMMELAQKYVGDRAIDLTGSDPDNLYESIDRGLPVWVITTTSFAPVNNFKTWDTPQGKIDVTFSVHSVVITGYTDQYVYINDPYGQKNQKVNRSQFEKAWKQMGKQAIVIERVKN